MSDETVREDQNATVREGQNAAATIREEQDSAGTGGVGVGSIFQGYHVVRQLPTKGSEADIFVVEKDSTQYILKLYRYGVKPKRDILLAIKALSENHPHEFVRLFDADFDASSGRWYEIQEYVPNGSLQTLMADRSLLTGAQQATFFNDVARELSDALHALHQNNLLHLDLKPSNILLRSVYPLNLVLIDFGITTALDSDMSKKFTQARGTPMYQSPESYSGGVGRPTDWWGLGMILLEIVAGKHPFRGLGNSVIMEWALTKPAPIPENLNAGQEELLRGLLTRDPEKRWKYEQVSRWLSGERNIPQYFETASAQPVGGLTPITFMGEQYRNLADLALAFLKNEQTWEKGKIFLLRGYVKQWLEKNDEFDAIIDMDKVMSGTEDPDEKLFRFAQRFGGDVPFAFGGHLITLQNLLLFAGKVLKRQPVTAMEQKIVDSIVNGVLLSWLNFYKQQGQTSGTVQDLEVVLESLKGKQQEDIAGFLDFCLHPENYYCPSLQDNTTIGNITKYVTSSLNVPITVREQERREQEKREQERREQERKEQERKEQKRKRILYIVVTCIAFLIVLKTIIIPIIISNIKKNEFITKYGNEVYNRFGIVEEGKYITFGSYEQDNNASNGKENIEWLVLKVDGNKALVINKYALDCKQYNYSYSDVTWETCSLRSWLNGTFMNTAFNSEEQNGIINSTVTADKNPSYSTSPGNNTTDKVFLLSISEVNKYFNSYSARQCQGTAYCCARGAFKDDNNFCWWWLRSPGHNSRNAAIVHLGGSVYDLGDSVNYNNDAVRPALWINLGS